MRFNVNLYRIEYRSVELLREPCELIHPLFRIREPQPEE
jgi:hypothetical protein